MKKTKEFSLSPMAAMIRGTTERASQQMAVMHDMAAHYATAMFIPNSLVLSTCLRFSRMCFLR
jgi:hypothetical protein